MKKTLFATLGIAAALLSPLFAGADIPDTEINLVQQGDFKPVIMHGRPSAAFGWYLRDQPRGRYSGKTRKYLSGEGLFELSFADGAVTFSYPDPLHPAYEKATEPIVFAPRVASPQPPAPEYLITARVKFARGKLSIPALRRNVRPSAEWKEIRTTAKQPFDSFSFRPEAGSSFSFAKVKCIPVYPKIGGEIALPDGGKLTRFLLPENADYMTRWGVALWRGWLWKLTGVALPIETVKKVEPTSGAFAFLKGEAAPGGWHLVVNKEGIVLTANDERALSPALFDYLRMGLKCAWYGAGCVKVPKDGSVKELPAIDRTAKPKYATMTGDDGRICMSGGIYLPTHFSTNDCDYFHLAGPSNDHILNVLLPMEMYFKKHPEYFMLDRFGRRVKTENPGTTNPCFSSEEAMRLMVDNFVDYAKGQSLAKVLQFSPGDAHTLCLCPECIKFNGGRTSNTDAMIEYVNRLMPKLAEARPDLVYHRDIYASHHDLPTHVKPATTKNVVFGYCVGHDVLPCTLHVDCEVNRRCLNELNEWARLAGGPQNLGYDTYRDIRPLHHLKQMEYLNRFGKNFLYMFIWKGYSPATAFTTTRWNLGEDPEKLLAEFDNAYYGKGGKFVHEINLLVEKFAENYKHTPEELNFKGFRHLCIWGGDLGSRTLLDRKTFDAIYALFDKALEAAKDDPAALRRILKEKKFYLAEDLLRYNRASCATDAELAAFAARLADLVRCARRARGEYKDILYGVSGRDYVTAVAGWDIPNTGKYWADEPAVEQFLKEPGSAFRAGAEAFPGGWYFKPGAIKGASMASVYSYQCPPRLCVSLSRPSLKGSSAKAVLPLAAKPTAPFTLAIEGLDDDKAGASLFKVEVNGHTLFEGPNSFKEKEWSRMTFMIPAEYLAAGDNEIRISNVTPDTPSRSVRFTDPEEAKCDGQWGWIMVSEIIVLDPSGDFAAFAAGKKDARWRQNNTGLKAAPGKIAAGGGKVVFTSGKAPFLRLSFFRDHRLPKIPVVPGSRVRMTVTASGSGKAQFRLNAYKPYAFDKAGNQVIPRAGYSGGQHYCTFRSPEFELAAAPKEFSYEFKPEAPIGIVFPNILLLGDGQMTVTAVKVELIPPTPKQ